MLGVTAIVGLTVTLLSVMQLARLVQVRLDESRSHAELLANAIYHRARQVVGTSSSPYDALRADSGLRSILESSLYSENVTFAAIVDTDNVAVVHADPSLEGTALAPNADLRVLIGQSGFGQLRETYRGQGRNFDFNQPLLIGNTEFGSIRIGVSTLLVRRDLDASLRPAALTALIVLAVAIVGAMILAQVLLRPIHVIRSGLTRLGQGELNVKLDLRQQDEFGELGTFFNAASAQLSADRSQMADQVANLESAVEHLEDAVAIVDPGGELLFVNSAMALLVPGAAIGARLDRCVPEDHPLLRLAGQTLASRQSRGPMSAVFTSPAGEPAERLLMTYPIEGPDGTLVGIMLTVRNLEYLTQVQSTIRYSRKLAALGRLSAGVAHEVKNPLNAMMIHLELLRQYVSPRRTAAARADNAGAAVPSEEAGKHIDIIANEIRRLDEVVQGFLKFSR
ncbi:MAG: HAMP domain-containing protein, partial [Acidobacteriaceae bacterium]|nr:HAMP domain-containing protein [Acidobacteriaceae bacterium]